MSEPNPHLATEHDRWVYRHLHAMRAQLRQRQTIISGVGARMRSALTPAQDTRELLGPTGKRLRIIQYRGGGTAVEEWDDRRHAVIRPHVHLRLRDQHPSVREAITRRLRTLTHQEAR